MPTDSDYDTFPGHRSQASVAAVPAAQVISTLQNDVRLLTGAGVIAGHAARQAGLAEEVQEHLATATMEACSEIFAAAGTNSKSHALVKLMASRFPDRLEITVELATAPGNAKAGSRSKRPASKAAKAIGKLVEAKLVDEVQRDTRDGRPAILLLKYFRPLKSRG